MLRSDIKEIAAMKQNNDHGGALELAAKLLGADDLESKFARINKEHARLGDLPDALYQERYQLYVELMAVARKRLPPAWYERLHAAF